MLHLNVCVVYWRVGRILLFAAFDLLFRVSGSKSTSTAADKSVRSTPARVYASRGKDLNVTSWDFEVTFLSASVWYPVSVPFTT